jgi:radical SAM protein with 4Fe4S-binding SPASM domain
MLMTLNRNELSDIKDMADDYGIRFRFDPALFPRINGDKSPICLRIPAEEAIALELADRKILQGWADYFKRTKETPASDNLYQCGAGLFSFHIDPYGNLQPCLMAVDFKYNLLKGNFQEGWCNIIPRIRDVKAETGYACHTCDARTICGQCPAFFKLEMDNENLRSEYVCAMGRKRLEIIHQCVGN